MLGSRQTREFASFTDLIAARAAMRSSDPPTEAAKQAFEAELQRFRAAYGEVKDVYWAADGRSAVAITVRGRFFRTAQLHRVSDHATRQAPDIAGAIADWEILAVRAQMLRGANAHVCMQWIFAAVSYLLAQVVAANGKVDPETTKRILARQQEAMRNAQAYYVVNATRGAYVDYFWGMILGAAVNSLLAFLSIVFVRDIVPRLWSDVVVVAEDQSFAFGCVVAGALGAILSVLLRMSAGRFGIEHEVGRSRLWLIGSFRPFIGAVSGLAVFLALKGGFVEIKDNQDDSFFVFAFVAFLAGFSERFARDTFLGAERRLAPAGDADPHPSGGATVEGQGEEEEAPPEELPDGTGRREEPG